MNLKHGAKSLEHNPEYALVYTGHSSLIRQSRPSRILRFRDRGKNRGF